MFYIKPKDVTYTQMAIWIDTHVYEPNLDVEKLYQYLYLIVEMLSYKAHYFEDAKDYNEFSLYTATQLYLRLTNKKQYVLDSTGNPKLQKIRSILNYIKKTLFAYRLNYLKMTYKEYMPDQDIIDSNLTFSDSIYNQLLTSTSETLTRVEFEIQLSDFVKTLKEFLKRIPRKKSSNEFHNIYMSCMLSMLNGMTLSVLDEQHLSDIRRSETVYINLYNKLYEESLEQSIILFHLDESFRSYITILVRRFRIEFSKELEHFLDSPVPISLIVNDVVNSLFNVSEDNDQ